MHSTLFIIPARGGSKGVPGKNIKVLGDKPLIYYSIDYARQFTSDENICVTTDDDDIIACVKKHNLGVPFKRPDALATDTANSSDVILHALEHYKKQGKTFEKVVLLQPSSPFRQKETLEKAFEIYNENIDMVVSVKETDANPYYVLFEEDEDGYISKSKSINNLTRRQDVPKVYELNGSIYVINVNTMYDKKSLANFTKTKKVMMDSLYSVDIDTPLDWMYCEFLLEKNIIDVK